MLEVRILSQQGLLLLAGSAMSYPLTSANTNRSDVTLRTIVSSTAPSRANAALR